SFKKPNSNLKYHIRQNPNVKNVMVEDTKDLSLWASNVVLSFVRNVIQCYKYMKLLFFFLGLLLLVGCATEVGVYSPPPPTVIYYRPYCGPCLHNRPFCGPRFHGHYWCPRYYYRP
ncbi:MAG TPA: hypothetical protein PLC59_10150, partial [Bacteroidales bacterium]|nr:hypothetical protein [Bacteroidales bacterium]